MAINDNFSRTDLQASFRLLENVPSWQPAKLADPQWAVQTVERPQGMLNLAYEHLVHGDGHDARFMRLTGPKVDVQTFFIYPAAHWLLPVFAAETVVIGQRAQVLVLDTPLLACDGDCAVQEQVQTALQTLAARFELHTDAEAPAWYQECRSPWDIFLRTPEAQTASRFDGYAAAAAQTWMTLQVQARKHPDRLAHQAALLHYKRHHQDFSPGVPMMSRFFGPGWTAGFMQSFFA